MSDINPFQAPQAIPRETEKRDASTDRVGDDWKRIENLINDADHFWVAILISFCCFPVAGIYFPFVYHRRLRQWEHYALKHQDLLSDETFERSSLSRNFQNSHWKLKVGLYLSLVSNALYFILILGLNWF